MSRAQRGVAERALVDLRRSRLNKFCAQLHEAAPDTGARPSEHSDDRRHTRLSKFETTTRMPTAS